MDKETEIGYIHEIAKLTYNLASETKFNEDITLGHTEIGKGILDQFEDEIDPEILGSMVILLGVTIQEIAENGRTHEDIIETLTKAIEETREQNADIV